MHLYKETLDSPVRSISKAEHEEIRRIKRCMHPVSGDVEDLITYVREIIAIRALSDEPSERDLLEGKYHLGDRLTKVSGASWTGHVVGFYRSTLTEIGYAIESENEPGSVQIYPEKALTKITSHLEKGKADG